MEEAIECLGKGFDLTSDFRWKFAKGKRLVVIDEGNKRDITVPVCGTIPNVSHDIRCDKGDRLRFKSHVLQFNQMSELLNQKSAIQGKIPSGYFNALFDLSGDWSRDAQDIKYLAFDGYFISLYYLHLTASHLILQDEVKKSVPPQWDPASLSRFIQTYGTHIIIGMAVGGQDVICVKQKHSSKVPPGDLRRHLENLGDFLFSDLRSPSQLPTITMEDKQKVPEVFNRAMQSSTMQLTSISETSSKDGLTIICSKRGGNVFNHNHSNWLQTVASNPEAILFKFVPISSLLTGIPGSGYLSHAINLYLRYKAPPEDLQYFLEFQIPRQWAPMFYELPLRHQRKKTSSPSLQFSLMSPKLHVSSAQVVSEEKPVVGLRLYLEGRKCDRLAIHVNHLSSVPNTMIHSSGTSLWRGSDSADDESSSDQFLEPIRWKGFANVCTSVVKHDPNWLHESGGVYVVTGAQLISKGSWPKNVLHLRLLYTNIPNCSIRKSDWSGAPEASRKSTFLTNLSTTFSFTQQQSVNAHTQKQAPTALDSGVYPDGPPVPVRSGKLLKYVDTSEIVRGPHDAPGHWLVTAAKLVTEAGKIGLQVKFALLDYY
ncbi:hypothetical protein Fmac_013854 [Flemingia macrophylla]|uniref:MACPF domain-containing protein n=1 Tax=Flemingia macrophylla TaxID=520843 RepID=A0ABD1MA64_9FABA